MSKLYYTNPIVAAYMAGEFGIRYITTSGDKYGENLTSFFKPVFWPDNEQTTAVEKYINTYYIYDIHPDSLSVFEPKEGDICQHPENNNCYSIEGRENISWAKSVNMKIIQRNNKPFFMPENEE